MYDEARVARKPAVVPVGLATLAYSAACRRADARRLIAARTPDSP
jgi:hypothetical protein